MGKTLAKKKSVNSQRLVLPPAEIIKDYRIAYRSRQASLIGRREVMGGKAKFGIFGDGKEVPQLAMARVFQKGDFRSGYYRDQTFMLALGDYTLNEFFAQLFAHADVAADPATAGRAMNSHFATRSLNADGGWKNLTAMYNSSADVSPTGSQMPRLVGLGHASRLYREVKTLHKFTHFSNHGNEIAFGMIGNATCAEGLFWESLNAIGVLRAPVLLSIWDDEFGISVSNKYQLTKQNLSELLRGFERQPGTNAGFDLYTVRAWDYPALLTTYTKAAEITRRQHLPAIIHVIEVTQPQGHSTSGSHERYKSRERLAWEAEHDCIKKMREWMERAGVATDQQLRRLEEEDRAAVTAIRDQAWSAYQQPILAERNEVVRMMAELEPLTNKSAELATIHKRLAAVPHPQRRDYLMAIHAALVLLRDQNIPEKVALIEWKRQQISLNTERYGSYLYSETSGSALRVPEVKPIYSKKSPTVNGFELLNACFDAAMAREPRLVAFGEDVGRLGDVNQGFRGLQEKYGELRIADTGIRECTIVGQAIGLALRGLRPIAEIQYLDYLLYALQILSDDLATLLWRTKGGQKAPVIIRTRGHRLEGIWHSGSLLAGVINLVRGINVLVPRNMTQAAGFYNTLLLSDEPAIVVEVLNGYRLKETVPDNIGAFTVPLGVPEVLRSGTDVTIVTYGACCRLVLAAAEQLAGCGVAAEVIDVQSLLPFDRFGRILDSLKKTSRIVFVDEDVPGGATAYMLQQVLENQRGYYWLDAEPRTLTGKAHRPAYGSDGDYFSKPNIEQIFETVYDLMHESNPARFPHFY